MRLSSTHLFITFLSLSNLSASEDHAQSNQANLGSVTFQTDPNSLPALSFETWSDALNANSGHVVQPASDRPSVLGNPAQPLARWPDAIPNALRNSLRAARHAVAVFISFGLPSSDRFFPHHDHAIDLSEYTIGQVLNWTLHHEPKSDHQGDGKHVLPLQRLAWLVNLTESVQDLLYDPKADLTLFAPDNEALTPPWKKHPSHHHHHHHQHPHDSEEFPSSMLAESGSQDPIWAAVEHLQSPEAAQLSDCPSKEKLKKMFKFIVKATLLYHVSPQRMSMNELLEHSTIATALPIARNAGAPKFRLRIGTPHHLHKPGQVSLNFFSKIGGLVSRPVITKNGIIHIVHHAPLTPPFSPLSQIFLVPNLFSTFTSGVQKVDLDHILLPEFINKTSIASELDEVDPRIHEIMNELVEEQKISVHKRSFTVFVPTNHAFAKLGPFHNAFLFSPLGKSVLRYILSYHIVPDIVWYSDHTDNVTSSKSIITRQHNQVDYPASATQLLSPPEHSLWHPHSPKPLDKKVNITEFSLPTLLGSGQNETLKLCVVKFKNHVQGHVERKVFIKPVYLSETTGASKPHEIPVIVADAPAWGGAVHVIPSLIHPPIRPGHKHSERLTKVLGASAESY